MCSLQQRRSCHMVRQSFKLRSQHPLPVSHRSITSSCKREILLLHSSVPSTFQLLVAESWSGSAHDYTLNRRWIYHRHCLKLVIIIIKLEMVQPSDKVALDKARCDLKFLDELLAQQGQVRGYSSEDLLLQRRLVNEFVCNRRPVKSACLVCSDTDP
jgi:hypothetical protein